MGQADADESMPTQILLILFHSFCLTLICINSKQGLELASNCMVNLEKLLPVFLQITRELSFWNRIVSDSFFCTLLPHYVTFNAIDVNFFLIAFCSLFRYTQSEFIFSSQKLVLL